jgi:hypothetical protein
MNRHYSLRRGVSSAPAKLVVARKVAIAKRRAAGRRIAANIRLRRVRRARTAGQALAEARGERLSR